MATATAVRRVSCAECNKHSAHILVEHLLLAHKMQPSDYLSKYPDEPLYSELGRRHLSLKFGEAAMRPVRKKETVKVSQAFKPHLTSALEVDRYAEPGPYTPRRDERYIFPMQQTLHLLLGLSYLERNRVYIKGWSGTGKSQLVINAAACLNYDLFRVNGDSAISRSELIGEWVVRGNEMIFKEGILPKVMRSGALLLLDEGDCLNPHTWNVLRPVLEDKPRLIILENGGEVVEAHPDFRVVLTANTWGTGDTTGLFGTAGIMSAADRQRFNLYIKLDYMPKAEEEKMLKAYFPDLEPHESGAFLTVANEIREKHKEGKIDEGFSPRQLINWIEKFVALGDVMEAARVCFLNAADPTVEVAVTELIQRAFPNVTV